MLRAQVNHSGHHANGKPGGKRLEYAAPVHGRYILPAMLISAIALRAVCP
jgi:hypothetical protein